MSGGSRYHSTVLEWLVVSVLANTRVVDKDRGKGYQADLVPFQEDYVMVMNLVQRDHHGGVVKSLSDSSTQAS